MTTAPWTHRNWRACTVGTIADAHLPMNRIETEAAIDDTGTLPCIEPFRLDRVFL